MRVLLCLGDTKLLQSVVRKIPTECVADRLAFERNELVRYSLVVIFETYVCQQETSVVRLRYLMHLVFDSISVKLVYIRR